MLSINVIGRAPLERPRPGTRRFVLMQEQPTDRNTSTRQESCEDRSVDAVGYGDILVSDVDADMAARVLFESEDLAS
jgi:hypothetical protein